MFPRRLFLEAIWLCLLPPNEPALPVLLLELRVLVADRDGCVRSRVADVLGRERAPARVELPVR